MIGELGIIPGSMATGCFIVEGKGNPDSLWSSSHGSGRVGSRRQAKRTTSIEDFKSSMEVITAKVDDETLDESVFAYKDIFKVVEAQKDLISIKYHIKPLINIKG